MDIWNYINTDVYKDSMKPLISKYRKYLVSKEEDEESLLIVGAVWKQRKEKQYEAKMFRFRFFR